MFCLVILSESGGGWNKCNNERDLVINSKSGLIPPEITSSVYWIAGVLGVFLVTGVLTWCLTSSMLDV